MWRAAGNRYYYHPSAKQSPNDVEITVLGLSCWAPRFWRLFQTNAWVYNEHPQWVGGTCQQRADILFYRRWQAHLAITLEGVIRRMHLFTSVRKS